MKRLIFKDGLIIEGIGEASKDNVKLEAVKKTLNMMAETRALNRAIGQAISGELWNRIEQNLANAKIPAESKQRIVDAGRVSFEEMQQADVVDVNVERVEPVASTTEEIERMVTGAIHQAKSIDVLIDLDEKIKGSDKFSNSFKATMQALINKRSNELQQ